MWAIGPVRGENATLYRTKWVDIIEMREAIEKILNLVAEGKISAAEGMDLIEKMKAPGNPPPAAAQNFGTHAESGNEAPPPPPPSEHEAASSAKDPVAGFFESVERFAKDVAESVKWDELSQQLKDGAKKSIDLLKVKIDQARENGFDFGSMFSENHVKTVELPLHVEDGKVLKIHNPTGNVTITSGAQLGSVTAVAKFRAANEAEAKEKGDRYNLILEESDRAVEIRQPDISGLMVDLTIQLSSPTPIEVHSSAGKVKIVETGKSVKVTGSAGNIQVSGADGVIEITTSSGNIQLSGSKSDIATLENKSGDIVVTSLSGGLNCRSASGNVIVTDSGLQTMAIEAVSGNVKVDLNAPVMGNFTIRTVHGNTEMAIPDGNDCRVALATLSGTVQSVVELQDRVDQDQRISGSLGSGNGSLDISAVSGNVSLNHHLHQTI